MTQQRTEIIDRINELALLKENWDSYGALPPSPETIRRAKIFAQEFLVLIPHITCTNNGKVMFEGNDASSIEIGDSSDSDQLFID
jgi:hypothetical protein